MKELANKKKPSLNSQTILSLISIIVLDAITYLTNPIFVNLLSQSAFGTISLYTSYREILMVVFGLQTLGSISYAVVHLKKGEFNKFCSTALLLSTISFVICSTITIVLSAQIAYLIDIPKVLIPLLVIHGFGSYIISFNSYRLIYEKKAGYAMLISGIVSFLSTGLSILLVIILKTHNGYNGYFGRVIGVFVPNVIIGLVFLVLQFKKAKPSLDKTLIKTCLLISVPLIFHRLGQIVLSRTDIVMINFLTSGSAEERKNQVAVYSYAVSMASIVSAIFNALNNSWVAFLFDDFKSENFSRIRKRSKNYIYLFTALTAGFLMIGPEIILWFAPENYSFGVNIIPLLTISLYLVFLSSFFVNIEIYHGKTIYTMIGTIFAALFNIALNYILIKSVGILGAAIATVISYFLLAAIHFFVSRFKFKKYFVYSMKPFITSCLIVTAMAILTFLYKDSIRARWTIGFLALFFIIFNIWKRKSIF